MSILNIVTPPEPILRQEADKVRAINSELRQLVEDMVETMRSAQGVGLAAPQVAVGQRVVVVEFAEPPEDPQAEPNDPELYRLINPEIIHASQETVVGNEGCLSLPGYYGEVERSLAVTVKALTPGGEATRIKAQGWLARIFQHEIDHLNGILFIDRATRVWELDEEEAGEITQA